MTKQTALTAETAKTPSDWVALGDHYDCTVLIGQLGETQWGKTPEWPMYSFDRPSRTFWNAVAAQLNQRGWTDEEIKTWLQSKAPRHAFDGALGDAVVALGTVFANQCVKVEN